MTDTDPRSNEAGEKRIHKKKMLANRKSFPDRIPVYLYSVFPPSAEHLTDGIVFINRQCFTFNNFQKH